MIKRFFIYGIAGWGIEIIWTGIGSLFDGDLRMMGYSNLWMFFIYGCAVFLEPIHHAIEHWHWFLRGALWVAIIWAIEYGSGWLLYSLLGVHPWYYTDGLSVNGFITLAYAPAWFIAGMVFERLHRMLDRYRIA
ncbi:MAG TPA: hypothetical protein DD738_02020 [Ruminiclostridium sp.]|jgi:uncharacterized membrane protein|nr:hypothetical protein [Ruminiclostridium sp.]